MRGLIDAGTCYGHKIYYDPNLYEQFIVLWPNAGHKEMHRFDKKEQAESFIEENYPQKCFY